MKQALSGNRGNGKYATNAGFNGEIIYKSINGYIYINEGFSIAMFDYRRDIVNLIAPLTTILCSPAPLFWKLLTARPPNCPDTALCALQGVAGLWATEVARQIRWHANLPKPDIRKNGLQMGISCNFTTSIQNWRWSPNVYYFEPSRTVFVTRGLLVLKSSIFEAMGAAAYRKIPKTCTTCAGPGTAGSETSTRVESKGFTRKRR